MKYETQYANKNLLWLRNTMVVAAANTQISSIKCHELTVTCFLSVCLFFMILIGPVLSVLGLSFFERFLLNLGTCFFSRRRWFGYTFYVCPVQKSFNLLVHFRWVPIENCAVCFLFSPSLYVSTNFCLLLH